MKNTTKDSTLPEVREDKKFKFRDLEKYNPRIELVLFHFLRVKNFDRSPAMLKIFALIKQNITNPNLRTLFISKSLNNKIDLLRRL
ncbi:MAG: hypothetical protein AAF806_11965 [Bacteroidota bacterium]